MVSRVAVVSFDGCRSAFADNVAFRGQNLGESFPVVCVKNAIV